MEHLSRKFLEQRGVGLESVEIGFHVQDRQERILQFGEGNFLRAFIDFFVDELNGKGLFDGNVIVVQPIDAPADIVDSISVQDGCYTVILRGLEDNAPTTRRRVITSVSRAINPYRDFDLYMDTIKNPHLRFIVSNTTEAGIVFLETDKPDASPKEPPASFPAKIAALLYERYRLFDGSPDKGFIFIPCELIDDNGTKLRELVLRHAKDWGLPQKFIDWVCECNHFTNTLVDRIVTGYPKDEASTFADELGYHDDLLVAGEIFHFFAIEAGGGAAREINEVLPFHKAGLNVVLTTDVTPYKLRKVRILNGAHTMSVLAALLCGKDTVGEMMKDSLFVEFLRKGIYQEIIPTLSGKDADGLQESDLLSFADSVFDRFANPYIKHYLLSIALNSVSKFKARVLPSILDYYRINDTFPKALTLSFAALIAFYKKSDANDSEDVLEFFKAQWLKYEHGSDLDKLVKAILANDKLWDTDLTQLPGFCEEVAKYLCGILTHGSRSEIEAIIGAKA